MSHAISNASETELSRQAALTPILPNTPLLSSIQSGWQGITLEHFRYPPFETPEYAYTEHKIAIHTQISPELQVKRRLDGRVQYQQVFTEQVIVVPATVAHQVQWDQPSEFLILTLNPDFLQRIAYEAIAPDQVDLVPCLPKSDPLIQQIGLALKAELEANGGSDRGYVESLIHCLGMHLLKKYSAIPPSLNPPSGKLPQLKLKQVTTYIQEHLGQDLKLADLAALIGMSPCYFAWLFKQTTGVSPHQFIIQCRLERSQQLLKHSEEPIAEIAVHCGFSSQSHLTRLFRKHFNTTPKAYRNGTK
jgi:AraC family transcriptional regulator